MKFVRLYVGSPMFTGDKFLGEAEVDVANVRVRIPLSDAVITEIINSVQGDINTHLHAMSEALANA